MNPSLARLRSAAIPLACAMLIAACGSRQPAEDASAVVISHQASLTGAEAALVNTADKLAQARSEQLDLYSPGNMMKAMEALAEAQKLRQRGKSDADILQKLSTANSFLKAATDNKALAQTTLRESIEQRKVLEELQADKRLPREFAKSTDAFRNLMETLEGGNMSRAQKEQQKVLAQFAALEIAVLKETYLVPADNMLKKAESIDADDFAPTTYLAAKNTLATAHKVIESAPKDRVNVKLTGESALVAASRAYFVAEESRQLVKLDEKKAEQRVLHYFSLFERINAGGAVADLGTMSLNDQAYALQLKLEQAGGRTGRGQLEASTTPTAALAPATDAAEEPAPVPATTDAAAPAEQTPAAAPASAEPPAAATPAVNMWEGLPLPSGQTP